MNKTLLSLSHFSPLHPPDAEWTVVRRSDDWGLTRAQKLALILRDSLRLAWSARRVECLVLVTCGLELFLISLLLPRKRLVVVDWLMPERRLAFLAWLVRRVACFVVIRRADAETLDRRYRVPQSRTRFVHFPAPPDVDATTSQDRGYYYSAGWAHRDWPTALQALHLAGVSAHVSAALPESAGGAVQIHPQLSPAAGREYLRGARALVLALHDTDLPSGPLVLLDAMSLGKPVVASDVGGTRDYVRHGVNGLLAPPGDARALATMIRTLDEDPALRELLSQGALRTAADLAEPAFWAEVARTVEYARPTALLPCGLDEVSQ